MTLASLPTLSVQIAFNPTNIQSLTQTWTDVTPYVRDFTTKLGRQHFLDRVEAGTLNMTVNERTGFFLNGSVNGTGYVIQPRLPIKVTATWSGTTYPVFYGLIDSIDEKITDQLNVDLTINATDLVKFLSLRYMASTNFWSQYATSASATNWFRCDLTAQATVTAAVTPSVTYGSGYTDYTSVNNFVAGQSVYVNGLTTYTGSTQNSYSTAPVTYSNGAMFTLQTGNSAGTAGGQGTATQTNTSDQIASGGQAYYVNGIGFNPNGAMVYSSNGSIDLANGSNAPVGFMQISDVPGGLTASGALDFWILGQGTAGQQITTVLAGGYSGTNCQLWVSPNGKLEAVLQGLSGGSITAASASGTQFTFTGTFATSNITVGGYVKITGLTAAYNGEWKVISRTGTTLIVASNTTAASISGRSGLVTPVFRTNVTVNDGYWHHVGFCNDSAGQLNVYADGTLTPIITSGGSSFNGWSTTPSLTTYPLIIGAGNGDLGDSSSSPSLAALIDEIVISNNSNYSGAGLLNELLNRYKAGTLLTQGFPVTSNQVLSGDRIAEILCIAGFGYISGGQVMLNSNTYFINDSATAWVNGASGNGFIAVEPWYWDSPVTGSTALDLILQICDTDIGSFYQEPNGTFSYYNQLYYGTWNWALNATSGTWSPNSYTPTGDHVWTDDTSSTYHYYGPSLQVVRDDVDVWTTVKVSPQSGTQQIYENTANESRWGYSTLTKSSTVHTTLNLALSTANFLGNLFKTPLPRVGNVELRSETNNGQNMTALLNTEFGDVVTFKRTSPNASGAGVIPFSVVSSGSNTLSTSASTFNVTSTAGASTVGGFYVTVSGTTYFASYTGITTTSFTGVTLASGSVVVAAGTTIFLNPNMVVESIMHDFQAEPGFWHTSFILDPYPIRS